MEAATDTTQPEVTNDAPQSEEVNTPIVEGNDPNPVFDPSKIDPKVKEHFEKEYSTKYADYDESKKAAQQLNSIRNDPAFQDWLKNRNNPPPAPKPKEFEISDDQFTAALTDKGQFTKLVQDAAKHLLANEVQPKLQQTEAHFQLEAKRNELGALVQKYPDFKDLDKRGLIEPIIQKYRGNISFEDAYWVAKQHVYKEEIAKAARGQVNDRKGASVERPNNAPSAKRNTVKVADRLEAMERAAEDFRAGREVAEYEYD